MTSFINSNKNIYQYIGVVCDEGSSMLRLFKQIYSVDQVADQSLDVPDQSNETVNDIIHSQNLESDQMQNTLTEFETVSNEHEDL